MTEPTAIINFKGDEADGKFVLSGGTKNDDGTMTSSIAYTEAEAVNGVKVEGHEKNTYSTGDKGKSVYLNAIEKDVNKVTIGTVDLSDNATRRSFDNLTATGEIDVSGAKYSANKKIADVAGKTIQVVGATGENKFNNGEWTGDLTSRTFVKVNQETGISAVVNANYDTTDGNINLKTQGLESLTFGSGIAWSKDTTAVSLSGQQVEELYFTDVSFADSDKKKNETMRLLSAKDMDFHPQCRVVSETDWIHRADDETTYYDQKTRTHVAEDDLTGHGITVKVERGDQIVLTRTETEDGKKNLTLDYTRGKGYVTGMTIADAGITWENGKTAIKLAEDYDFSALDDDGIKFDGSTMHFSNADKISIGDTMTFFDADGYMSKTDWEKKVSVTNFPLSEMVYSDVQQAVTVSGSVNMEVTKTDGGSDMKVNAKVTDTYLSDITVDLSKIGNEETAEKSKWEAKGTIYSNTDNSQDYGADNKKTSVNISGSLFGGTTNESVKTNDTMTLVHIEGKNAGVDGNLTKYENDERTVQFSDTADNGLVATGSHVDTLQSTVKSANDATDPTKGSYDLTYTVGTKMIDGITATSIDLSKDAFTAGGQYTLSGDIAIDVSDVKVKYLYGRVQKDILDFSGDTSGSITLKDADASGRVTSTVSYAEEEETNGIRAEGTQSRTFAAEGNKVSIDLTQEVNKIYVGMVDYAKERRSFDDLAETGTVSTSGFAILDNLALTDDLGKSFTLATVSNGNTFSGWTLPTEKEDVYVRQETGVVGIMEGQYKVGESGEDTGNLMMEMGGIKSIYFADGVKWRNDSAVLDFTGTSVDFTGKEIDASKISFDATSVGSLIKTDGAYRMVLINTDAANHLDKANITNNENIDMTIADTISFKGQTRLSADKLQFVADMWRGTGTATDAAHRHVMAQAAAMQAIVNGNVETTDSISGALSHFRADDVKGNSMIFARVGGSSTTTQTGSHISENLWNVNVGVATRKGAADGAHSDYGFYYEGGTGNYSTHDAGEGVAPASGDLTHHGVGFLFRRENKNAVYGEAGFHIGRISNENSALGLDNSATYYGLHLGAGKIIRTSDKDSWDLYTKFYWNRTGGMDYRNSAVTDIHLDAVTSKLLRIGGRYSHQVEKNWSFYTGAALSYEFGGSADGTAGIVNGDSAAIRTATIKGAGAVLELGFRKEAAKGSPWEIDLGIKGYMGRQKGFGGNIGINYHF